MIPVRAANYYAAMSAVLDAHLLGDGADLPDGADEVQVVLARDLARSLAQCHEFLDEYRVGSAEYDLTKAAEEAQLFLSGEAPAGALLGRLSSGLQHTGSYAQMFV